MAKFTYFYSLLEKSLVLFVCRLSSMVEWGSRPLLTKIVLGIAVFFSVIMLVCFCVGGPLYIQERSKTQSYVKDSCHVTSTSYETIDKCIDETVRTIRHRTCYIALWDVQLGGNSARKETIRSGPENSYQHMEAKQEQYKVIDFFLSKNHSEHTFI